MLTPAIATVVPDAIVAAAYKSGLKVANASVSQVNYPWKHEPKLFVLTVFAFVLPPHGVDEAEQEAKAIVEHVAKTLGLEVKVIANSWSVPAATMPNAILNPTARAAWKLDATLAAPAVGPRS